MQPEYDLKYINLVSDLVKYVFIFLSKVMKYLKKTFANRLDFNQVV